MLYYSYNRISPKHFLRLSAGGKETVMSNESIQFSTEKSNQPEFHLRNISFSKYEGDWPSLPHAHPFTELFYIINGKGEFWIDNERISVSSNDLIIINPNVEHTEKAMTNAPMEYIVFGVDGLACTFHETENYGHFSYTSVQNRLIYLSRLMMQEFMEKEPGFDVICQNILQVLFLYISREQQISLRAADNFLLSRECAAAKRYMDANYSKNITLDTLAEITHTNKYYLAHSFTECIGESPIHYLMNRRIQAGKDLLLNTNHSILQIAESTGFSSQSYFSQAFKKETGMTPQKFRKQNT